MEGRCLFITYQLGKPQLRALWRGECGGGKIYPPVADSPVDKLLEKTSPGALEPKKMSTLFERIYSKGYPAMPISSRRYLFNCEHVEIFEVCTDRLRLLWTQWNKPQIFDHCRILWKVFRRYRLSETSIACFFKKESGFSEVTGSLRRALAESEGAVFL